MSSQGAQHATHNSWRTNYCDVFVSFRGLDSRSFMRKLCKALLEKKINVFCDWGLEKGKTLHDQLFHAIRESRVYVVVLSENYASSSWCLDELAKIMEGVESTNKDNRKLCPVFYKVQQSDIVEKLCDGKQMAELAKRFERLQIWKSALTQIAHLPGWTWSERKESMIIQHMAELIHESLVGFDVFISFRNPDTGYNFTGNLYNALRQKKINTCFVDHELLKKMHGEDEPKFSPWDRIAEKLSFMLVFGDLVWIGMTQCRKRTVQKMWKSVIHGKSLQSLAGIVFQCRRLRMIEGSSKLQSPL
ncbi:disease resistance protein RUN1-like isoform X1 [Lotus japonicus]|uniref:disease resistance protein RUN1-like isoform X1 n=1 Tax=Lotus japonicus TaxID=34305 RepID=UPI00258323B0|nr:disease resistance protein RUN1-like isoform X1 [Lotus japonicus]